MLVPSWLSNLLTVDVLLQIGAFALAMMLGAPLGALLGRLVSLLQARAVSWEAARRLVWLPALLTSARKLLYPLAVLLLVNAGISALGSAGRPTALLVWLGFFVTLWLAYRLAALFVDLRMQPEHAGTWKHQILRPIVYGVAVMHALGLLDDVLEFGLRPSADILITLRSLLLGGLIIYGFMVLSRTSRTFLRERFLPRTGMDTALVQVLSTLAAYLVLVVGVLIGLGTIGINLTTLTVIAGGVSVGLGFGLQALFNNFVSGFILLSERSLVPGDVVSIDGHVGKVEDITLRTTQIRTIENIEFIVPNGHFLDNVVINFTRDTRKIQIHIEVSANYDRSPHEVMEALREAGDHPAALAGTPPAVLILELGEHLARYRLSVWIEDPLSQDRVRSEVLLRVWDLFQARGITLNAPDPLLRLETPGVLLAPSQEHTAGA